MQIRIPVLTLVSIAVVCVLVPAPSARAQLFGISEEQEITYQYIQLDPWYSLFPGAAIFVTVLGFNLLGDGLRQALDPRLQQ